MAKTSTYLNFARNTEEAFLFYKAVFKTEFTAPIQRMGEVPSAPGAPPLAEADKNLVMHVELPIVGGHLLMGTDASPSMGFHLVQGDNVHLSIEPDSLAEGRRLFAALCEGGTVTQEFEEMFWGAWYGAVIDRFGIRWMVNCPK